MSIPLKVVVEREIKFRQERTIATIYESDSGAPARPLITGRKPHTTGRPVCIKAESRAAQWESFRAELPFIEFAEIASPVRRIRAQPHQLDPGANDKFREIVTSRPGDRTIRRPVERGIPHQAVVSAR
jgi:hypothetical protein